MNNNELKALINKPRNTGPLKVGELVRVIPRVDARNPEESPTYTREMNEKHAGEAHIIREIIGGTGWVRLKHAGYTWHADWLERV